MKKINRKKFLSDFGMMSIVSVVAPSLLISTKYQRSPKHFSFTGKKIKVGVIGCGSVAQQYIPHLQNSLFVEVVSLCDIKPERAKRSAEKFKIANWYPHIDDMLNGISFNIFVNLTDMQVHGKLNRIALQAGKQVWSEKPLANTYKEGKALVDLAKEKGVRIWGAPVVVNSPQFAYMAGQINEGHMGMLVSGHGTYGHAGPDWSAFFYEKGGGCLPDLGVYNIATLTGLLGPAVSVSAIMNILTPERTVKDKGLIKVEAEDNAHLILEHQSGAISHLDCGFNYANPHVYTNDDNELYKVSIMGSKGQMYMVGYDWRPYAVDISKKDTGKKLKRMSTDRGAYVWEEGASLICEYLATGKEPLVNVEHSLHVLEIIENARVSQKTGKRIKLKSVFNWPIV